MSLKDATIIVDEEKDWPLSRAQREIFVDIFENLFKPATRRDQGFPLWSVVRDLIGYGSTSATRFCEYLGLDPHMQVVRRVQR